MIESLFSMQNKICVVTGGSRGLGAFMAQGFLEAGAKRVSRRLGLVGGRIICTSRYVSSQIGGYSLVLLDLIRF